MRKLGIYMLVAAFISSCQQRESEPRTENDLSALKNEFLQKIYITDVEEGPFSFNYRFRTVFFSKDVISLFGELSAHDRLPHGYQGYEGKTLCKIKDQWQEVQLNNLFPTDEQKEFLRTCCEKSLKSNPMSYFSGDDPIRTILTYDDIHTFIVDEQNIMIIFQPYSVGSGADGPFLVKIPFADLKARWKISHQFYSLLEKAIESDSFISSWDLDDFYERLAK